MSIVKPDITYVPLDPINAKNMERILVDHFNPRVNIIVPNVGYGLQLHDCDLLILTKSNYAIEIEIKISAADLRIDKHKRHGHVDRKNRIKTLYFAVPPALKELALTECPERAGIIVVYGERHRKYYEGVDPHIEIVRKPTVNKSIPFTDSERNHLLHLGIQRYWSCKSKLLLYKYRIDKEKTK